MMTLFRMVRLGTAITLSLTMSGQFAGAEFAGSSNYVLSGDCKPISNLTVTIRATQDIVGPKGLGFQLNATAPTVEAGKFTWQQYMMGIGPQNGINYAIQDWYTISGQTGNQTLFVPSKYIWPMPNVTLPKDYSLTISLWNSGDNVIGATFMVQNKDGLVVPPIEAVPMIWIKGALESRFDPVYAFQLNLVGPTGGENLSQGAGWISYTASTPLTVSTGYPKNSKGSCVAVTWITGENSNVIYSPVTSRPNNTFRQTFWVPQQPMTNPTNSGAPVCRGFDPSTNLCITGGHDINDQAPK
jgi:hypothetical protein